MRRILGEKGRCILVFIRIKLLLFMPVSALIAAAPPRSTDETTSWFNDVKQLELMDNEAICSIGRK